MKIEPMTRNDFDYLTGHHGEYWDSDLTLALHHPMFIHEFGDTAFVVRDGDRIAAYFNGFFCPDWVRSHTSTWWPSIQIAEAGAWPADFMTTLLIWPEKEDVPN